MRKILGLFVLTILAAYSLTFAAAATGKVAGTYWGAPCNTWTYVLGSDATVDSLYTSSGQVEYGPYSICQNPGRRVAAKYFRSYMPSTGLASGDSVILFYQMLYGPNLTDTTTTWTAADTLTVGKKGAAVDISALPGIAIMFKLVNADASKVGLIKKCRIVMSAPATESPDVK